MYRISRYCFVFLTFIKFALVQLTKTPLFFTRMKAKTFKVVKIKRQIPKQNSNITQVRWEEDVRLVMIHNTGSNSSPPYTAKVCPPLSTKNSHFYRPLLALGECSSAVFTLFKSQSWSFGFIAVLESDQELHSLILVQTL